MTRVLKGPALALAMGLVVLGLAVVTSGCTADAHSRQVEATHWHDEDTFVLVYTRQQRMGTLRGIFRPEPKSNHVQVCRIDEDNQVTCSHQRQVSNILNPHKRTESQLSDD